MIPEKRSYGMEFDTFVCFCCISAVLESSTDTDMEYQNEHPGIYMYKLQIYKVSVNVKRKWLFANLQNCSSNTIHRVLRAQKRHLSFLLLSATGGFSSGYLANLNNLILRSRCIHTENYILSYPASKFKKNKKPHNLLNPDHMFNQSPHK